MQQNNSRFIAFITAFYILLTLLVVRLCYMQILKYDFYRVKSQNQLLRTIKLYPHRGNIYDRNMRPLAVTKTTYSAYTFPAQIANKALFIQQVSHVLDIPPDTLSKKIYSGIPFIWLKRKLDPEHYIALKNLRFSCIDYVKEDQRIYPNGTLAASVLGFVGIDNQGLGGLEYKYDSFLKGSSGKIMLEGDPRGFRVISGYKKTLDTPYDGGHIVTTLDSYVQYVTQKYLKQGVEENGAASGEAIVLDPQTGDVLAMATYPQFDPNHWHDATAFSRKNRCVSDMYEPGSVFKILTVSSVIEEKLVSPETIMYVPATLELGGRTIREAHGREAGDSDRRTVSEIIEKSLNVGTTMLARRLGEKKFYDYLVRFKIGKRTGIELPGESPGLLRPVSRWSAPDIGMISFGQGIALTPIQMVSVVTAVTNRGELLKPRIIRYMTFNKNQSLKGVPKTVRDTLMSAETAQKVTDILTNTVERGTGAVAKIPGYTIAGKTGTAQKPSPFGRGYMAGQYIASFLGFFPAKNPQVLILVVIDSPQKAIYGAAVAGPVFKNIALDMISYLNIPPDK